VGAIANEAGIPRRLIGHIKIGHDHCLVELPQDLTQSQREAISRAVVMGRRLNLANAEKPIKAKKKTRKPPKKKET
jgi:hypothetical protein